MEKFTINQGYVFENGTNGPWGKALVSSDNPRFVNATVIELRHQDLAMFQMIVAGLDEIKANNQVLICEAEISYKKEVKTYEHQGRNRTDNVVTLYLKSDPKWSRETRVQVGLGNLADVLADVLPRDDGDIFS